MSRKLIIAGNWKMNHTSEAATALVTGLRDSLADVNSVDVVVCPPMTSLTAAVTAAAGSAIGVGSQNIHWAANGAFTGEEVPATENNTLRRRAAYQAVIGQYASVSASGDWADWVPAGMVGVVFRRVQSVDALGFARYSGDPIYGLVAKDRYAERNDVETFDSLGATRVESTAPITKEVHLA